MRISKEPLEKMYPYNRRTLRIQVDGHQLVQVNEFSYLRSTFNLTRK